MQYRKCLILKSMKERIKVLSDEKRRYRGLKQALLKNQNRKGSSYKDKKPQERSGATIQSLKHKCHCSSQAEKSKLHVETFKGCNEVTS